MSSPTNLELITMGRVGVDLYPEQVGATLAEVRSFTKSLGGSPTNVAVGAARLGHQVAVITKVGADGFGDYVRQAIAGFGVWPGWVGVDEGLHTPLAFAELHPPDHFPLLFYREPRAPDLNLSLHDLDLQHVVEVPLFWVTGTGLCAEPSRGTTLAALGARTGRQTVLDVDYRPSLWAGAGDAARSAREAAQLASVVVGNEAEAALLTGEREPSAALAAMHALGPRIAILKRGPAGVLGQVAGEPIVEVPPVPVTTVCGLGAGDAFGAGLCHGLLAGWPLERTLRLASAAGAIVASRLACADAMPTLAEVEDLVARV